jgi:hypothetical protein
MASQVKPRRPPQLETRCSRCDGRGRLDSRSGADRRCGACDGAGHVPTEWGEQILALLRHNLPAMY